MYTYFISKRNHYLMSYKYIDNFAYNHNIERRAVSNPTQRPRYFFFSKSYEQLEKAHREMRNLTPTPIREIRLDELPSSKSCSYDDLRKQTPSSERLFMPVS